MKKIIYLCFMLLLSINTVAQVDYNDLNWECVINEDFSGVRSWDSHWDDQRNIPGYKPLWRCFSYNLWNSGVTKYNPVYPDYSAYQPSNAVFSTDNTLKLVGEYKSFKEMTCSQYNVGDSFYSPAPWYKYCHFCDDSINQCPNIHYYSGMIESTDSVGYGYYEIRCKMPVQPGTHDAFWFWGNYGYYEEIDVFEHGANYSAGNIAKGFNAAIFYNANGSSYLPNPETGDPGAQRFQYKRYLTPASSLPLNEYHTYGCLWLPERIAWYFDGILFNEETDPNHIPRHPMWLKIMHFQDESAREGSTWWQGSDEMTIDYVKVFRLKTNCSTDATIRTLYDFNHFNYSVKRSVTMGGQSTSLVIPDNTNFTMRAVESITIDGSFEAPQGTEMTLIIQDCPECSQEGVHSQNYCSY